MDPFSPPSLKLPSLQEMEKETLDRMRGLFQTPSPLQTPEEEPEEEEEDE